MKQKRRHDARSSKRSAGTSANLLRSKRIVWVILAALLLAGGSFWFVRGGGDAPALPDISTAQLDPVAARLIEQHLDAVRNAPRSGKAWGTLGALLRSFKYREEARRCLEHAEQLDSKEPRWPYLQGLLLSTTSPTEAIARLRQAVALCGNEPEAVRLLLARLLAESGQWAEAQGQLEELFRAKPDCAPASLALAQAALARDAVTEAITLAELATKDRRTARAAWSLLGVLQQRRGDTNAAKRASQRAAALPADAPAPEAFAMETSPARSDARDLSDRSQRLLESGRLAEAAPLVAQLVRDHPQFPEGWLLLGRWQLLSTNLVAAETSLRRHLAMEPASVNGLFQLGRALLMLNRFEDAAKTFEQATRLKPDFGPGFYNLGFALARAGQRRAAMPSFREAIRHNPERIDSYILLADLHVQFGERAEAQALLQQAEAINPTDRRLATLRLRITGE